MLKLAVAVTFTALLSACSRGRDAGSSSSSGSAAIGSSRAVDRGPTTLPLDGDPNGLWWDGAADTLLIADSANNRILRWTDGGGIVKLADLPPAPQKNPGLGQLVKTPAGEVFVTRFGFGTAGDVVYVAADGSTGKVPGLDPQRRRIGLAVAADGTLYDAYFVKDGDQSRGAVARLDRAGTETDVSTGMTKAVGVLVSGADLFASDQAAGTVVKVALAVPGKATVMAQVPTPDLLCAGPDGSLFTGGTTGEIRKIGRDGKLSTFAGGFSSVRGVAYDAKNKRLFASEHDAHGKSNALRILPVN
jgi:sugar lactone lactonase YvrE